MQIRPDNIRVFEPKGVSQAGGCGGASPGGATACSKVQVSGDAQRLSELRGAEEGADEARADRVAQLKEQVQNGTYKVDLEGLADLLAQKLS